MKDPDIKITVKLSDGSELPPGVKLSYPDSVWGIIYAAALAGFPAYRRELAGKRKEVTIHA